MSSVAMLYLSEPLADEDGNLTITELSSRQASWQWHAQHPGLMQIFIWRDKAEGVCDAHTIPIHGVRSITARGVTLREGSNIVVARPGGSLEH